MNLRFLLSAIVLGFSSSGAVLPAQAASGASVPAAVEPIIAGYAKQCRELGGKLEGTNHPLIMSADLDGDGKPDYVVNPQNLKCSAAATAFCGNGGCQISIALSGDGYRKPISELGGVPRLLQGPRGARVHLAVDATRCDVPKWEQSCEVIYSWKNGKVRQSYKAQPRRK